MTDYPPQPTPFPPPAPQPYPPVQPTYGMMGAPPFPPAGPKRYGRLMAILLAPFFSRGLYRDVARNWRGIAALYLLLLLAITWAAVMVKLHVGFTAFARDEFPKIADDVPPITIKDGVVSSPVPQPYEIKDHETGKVFAVLDTTGTINSLDDTPAKILLTQNKLHSREASGNQTKTYDLSQIKSFYLDKQKVIGWMNTFARWAFPLLYLPALLGSFALRLIQALIYAGIAMAFASMFQVRLTYQAGIRLAIIAVTPVILLDTIFSLTGVTIPFWTLLGIVIALVYLAVAVKVNYDPVWGQPPAQPAYPPQAPYMHQPPFAQQPPPATMPPPPQSPPPGRPQF